MKKKYCKPKAGEKVFYIHHNLCVAYFLAPEDLLPHMNQFKSYSDAAKALSEFIKICKKIKKLT